jgi:hypothetical protein
MPLNPFKSQTSRIPSPSPSASSEYSTSPNPPSTPQGQRLKNEFDDQDSGAPPSYGASVGGSGGSRDPRDDDRPLVGPFPRDWSDGRV